jgi:uncharacterized membrane protein YphA (DoxX/SURF4 family)
LLRGTVGITVVVQTWLFIASTDSGLLAAVPAAALIVAGVALTLGIFTPVCSAIIGLGYVLALFTPLSGTVLPRLDCAAAVIGLASAIGLALFGPGAFSIDARLFGRREIFIPADHGSDQS